MGLNWGVDMARHVKESKVEFHATFGISSHDCYALCGVIESLNLWCILVSFGAYKLLNLCLYEVCPSIKGLLKQKMVQTKQYNNYSNDILVDRFCDTLS